jgi:hypothetical protein
MEKGITPKCFQGFPLFWFYGCDIEVLLGEFGWCHGQPPLRLQSIVYHCVPFRLYVFVQLSTRNLQFLFELAIFRFQRSDPPIFGGQQHLFGFVGSSLMLLSLCPLSFKPFLTLLYAERFNTLSHILVSVEVSLGHMGSLCHRVEIDGLLLTKKLVNSLVNPVLSLYCLAMGIRQQTVGVRQCC